MPRRAACTASASRWSTRCPSSLEVEVARDKTLFRQAYAGAPLGPPQSQGAGAEPPRHHRQLHPRPGDLRRQAAPSSPSACIGWRAPRPTSSRASRSAGHAIRPWSRARPTRRPRRLHFPAASPTSSRAMENRDTVVPEPFAGETETCRRHGGRSNGRRLADRRGRLRQGSYCNTVPTPRAAPTSRACGGPPRR
jgi:hypothetical protein